MSRFTTLLISCFIIAVCSWACGSDSDDSGDDSAGSLTAELCQSFGSQDCGECLEGNIVSLCQNLQNNSYSPERARGNTDGILYNGNCSDGGELLQAYMNGYAFRGCGTMEDQSGEAGQSSEAGESDDE